MKNVRATGLLAAALTFLVAGCSVFGGKAAEEPAYRVVERDGEIEVREYSGYAVAETAVDAPFDKATGVGFRRLFAYISGANRTSAEIEMTAPVLTKPKGEKIAMAAPVLAQPRNDMRGPTASSLTLDGEQTWTIAFVLPMSLTAASAPAPTKPSVTLRDVAPRRVASIRFSGRFGNAAAEEKRRLLAAWLASRGIAHKGDWQFAGYNPPWTVPALRRNEVLVTLE